MKYVLQIKESIFPRLKANQYYFLGDIDEAILYGSVPLFERFLKPGSEFIGFFLFDTLTQTEQANILSKVEKSKNHPEFLQYQLLRVVESLKQPPTVSAQTKKTYKTGTLENDSTAKTKRKKASENDVLEAMELLKERAETPNIKDWEKGTIILFLRSKGYNLELSKKTKIGKYWAIIYEKKNGSPPPHWYSSDIKKARDVLSRDGISFNWFL